ncbi:hypothetical protein LSUE1_G000958 [Lachnellula suecica]|uniref:Ubiquitin interaction motif protein n=1 Tax=Lachnellula suecica TaxID=602035 RepID=A0A8T9CJA9_9HELO|nr:hypothetical protein LSUE1_G000958 [Lachnellula suecica]
MAAQPSDEDINAFLSFAGADIPRNEVIARIKVDILGSRMCGLGNNNNVEQAIGEYFDDPTSQKYNWDDSAFSSDREGTQGNHGVSFDIQGPDVPGPSSYSHYDGNGLASRPPSRTSHNKSPLGKIIDLTADAAAADPRTSSYGNHEDSDLAQALAVSRVEAGLPPQESGVTSTSEVRFGPATRNDYESGKWDMVPVGKSSVQEIMVDPEPEERKRDIDVPAFLRPSYENHRLGALLTIYHEVPLIREIFLPRAGHDVAPTYGFDKEWWKGAAIELPSVWGPDVPPPSEVTLELQRLMAFLDKTDRSYGSVDALAGLDAVKREIENKYSPEAAVLRAWRQGLADDQKGKLQKLFSQGAESEGKEGANGMDFGILELRFPEKDSTQETLYDIQDEVLWSHNPLTVEESPYLAHVADVIAFQIDGDESKKNVEIPAVWYPDRYLKSSRQAALDMRLRKNKVDENLKRIEKVQERLTNLQLPNGKKAKVKEVFNVALQHDQGKVQETQAPNDKDEDPKARESARKAAHLSDQFQNLIASIDNKLLALDVEKEKSKEAFRNLSTLYTDPASEVDPAAPKFHKYSLRGVSTAKNTMFAEPDLIDINLNGESPQSKSDQWWRIHFAVSGRNSVIVEKTTEDKVLEAAKTESRNILLVYASDKAMSFENKALPPPLEKFVLADNRAFKAEIREKENSQTHISSPGKRKYDNSDDFSNTSPRWENNANPKGYDTVPDGETNTQDQVGASEAPPAFNTGSNQIPMQDTPSQPGDNSVTSEQHEVIVGIDPKEIMDNGQEMQERSSMRMLAGATKENEKPGTVDSMDLDEVVEDANSAGESAAVKHVGFSK